MEILFKQATVHFEGRVVIEPLTLALTERRVGVIGLNGSGKTTLARLMNGLIVPTHGNVTVNGIDTATEGDAVRRKVGFIFQNPQNQIILPILHEDIALGLKSRGRPANEIDAAISTVLARFSIAHLATRRAHELSGGELQLAALASVLVTHPEIVILDEPTNQLDLKNRSLVERTIHELVEDVIVVSHDLDMLQEFDRVLLFDNGRLVADDVPARTIARYRELAG